MQWMFLKQKKKKSNHCYSFNLGGGANSLDIQGLRLQTSTKGSAGSVLGQGTKILHAVQHSQK